MVEPVRGKGSVGCGEEDVVKMGEVKRCALVGKASVNQSSNALRASTETTFAQQPNYSLLIDLRQRAWRPSEDVGKD